MHFECIFMKCRSLLPYPLSPFPSNPPTQGCHPMLSLFFIHLTSQSLSPPPHLFCLSLDFFFLAFFFFRGVAASLPTLSLRCLRLQCPLWKTITQQRYTSALSQPHLSLLTKSSHLCHFEPTHPCHVCDVSCVRCVRCVRCVWCVCVWCVCVCLCRHSGILQSRCAMR